MSYRGVVAEYAESLDELTLAAVGDANALLDEIASADPVVVRERLIAATPSVLGPYVETAGALSAVMFEDAYRDALGATYAARSFATLPAGLVSGMSRYAVGPLFGQSTAEPLSLLGGAWQKAIAGAGRATTVGNARQPHSSKVGWARAPRAGCCAFCAVLASRGAIYKDSITAGREAYEYHDFCRCVATAAFEGAELPYDLSMYEQMYEDSPYGIDAFREFHGLK